MNEDMEPGTPSPNDHQARCIRTTCEYIDRLLADIEGVLDASTSGSVFPRYSSDLTPAQRRTIENFVARLRARLVCILDGKGIARSRPAVPASRAVRGSLIAIDIAAEELRPKYMRGYGEISGDMATEFEGIAGELHGLIRRLDRYLGEAAGEDVAARLQRLESTGGDLRLLSRIEQIVTERGLVEFRGAIDSILDRAEDATFEIALFGRVSVGKSSLLNAVLDTNLLPVGATPVTAVPIRITYGERPAVTVSFVKGPAKTVEAGRIGEFAAEQQNPGNEKGVTRIVAAFPAPRLRDRVAFVDTPGLGSLATSGAVETLAYLPKCDLGVILIDAGSTLTAEDLQTILALQEAAVPVQILISKADLLSREDCETVMRYVKQHIVPECGRELPVYLMSILPSRAGLLDRWFEEQIRPLYGRVRELRASSLERKIAALRESVIAALEAELRRSRQVSPEVRSRVRAVETRLRRATGLIEETRAACRRDLDGMHTGLPDLFRKIAAEMMNSDPQAPGDLIRACAVRFVQRQEEGIRGSIEILAARLQSDLAESARDLGAADMPDESEFSAFVRGMPIFSPGEIGGAVARPGYAALLGRRSAEDLLARRIRREVGKPLEQALTGYGDILNEWVRVVTGRMETHFSGYADRYRAQAERLLREGELAGDEIRALEEDLARLCGVPGGGERGDDRRK